MALERFGADGDLDHQAIRPPQRGARHCCLRPDRRRKRNRPIPASKRILCDMFSAPTAHKRQLEQADLELVRQRLLGVFARSFAGVAAPIAKAVDRKPCGVAFPSVAPPAHHPHHDMRPIGFAPCLRARHCRERRTGFRFYASKSRRLQPCLSRISTARTASPSLVILAAPKAMMRVVVLSLAVLGSKLPLGTGPLILPIPLGKCRQTMSKSQAGMVRNLTALDHNGSELL